MPALCQMRTLLTVFRVIKQGTGHDISVVIICSLSFIMKPCQPVWQYKPLIRNKFIVIKHVSVIPHLISIF